MTTQTTISRLGAMRRLWRLTTQEARVFELLLLHREVTLEQIVKVAGLKSKKHVHVVINHLRKKMKDVAEIENSWGIGYCINIDRERLLHDLQVESEEIENGNQADSSAAAV